MTRAEVMAAAQHCAKSLGCSSCPLGQASESCVKLLSKSLLAILDTPADARVAEWRGLVEDFLDPDPCSYDHHGYCQAHGWFETEPPCPHKRARALLERKAE